MPLPGNAAMILSFDVEQASIGEHDEWHTREHMPERLAIPGFIRGSRWIAASGSPRYFVMYEVADIGVLGSASYLERLDHPTPWTAKMMKSYRGMTRGLCIPVAQVGSGLGTAALLARFNAVERDDKAIRSWVAADLIPKIAATRSIASISLFEAGLDAPMTAEQKIRGKDADFRSALLITSYDSDALASLGQGMQLVDQLLDHGASAAQCTVGRYQLSYLL